MAGLSTMLTQTDSPLARTGRKTTTAAARHDAGLSAADQESLKRVFEEKYEYIDNDLFHEDPEEAQRLIFDEAPEIPKPDTSWYHPVMDTYTAVRQSKNMGSVLLTAKQERALFLMYNYCRFRVCELRDELRDQHRIDPGRPASCSTGSTRPRISASRSPTPTSPSSWPWPSGRG